MSLSFQQQYDMLRESEQSKNTLIENLLEEGHGLISSLSEAELLLEQQKDSTTLYHNRSRELDAALKKKQREADSNTFVSVLVDGDCMNFLDSLIKSAEQGGQEAAQHFRSSVIDYVRNEISDTAREFEITIHIYGNLRGLTKAYVDAGILGDREDLDRFIRGFNMSHALFNIIDAGNGKECSDNKLREIFKLHFGNVHCKHIIFGGSADNGYARLFGPYSGDESASQRITLLEGPPFAPELVRLRHKFRTTSFPHVFRDSKIEVRSAPLVKSLPVSKASLSESSASYPPLGVPAPAPTLLQFPIKPSTRTETLNHNNHIAPKDPNPYPEGVILRNSSGMRIDPPLKISSSVVSAVKPRKMCNTYHLRQYCANPGCTYTHGEQLGIKEMDALRFLARQAPCAEGVWCEDELCYFGHRCPSSYCQRNVVGGGCRFSPEMHYADMQVAYEDHPGADF